LCYPNAKFDGDEITYSKASWKPSSSDKEWPRAKLWKGLATENITQAAAHDLLRNALRTLEAEGFSAVAHVHDEILIECKESDAEKASARLHEIMITTPTWAQNLPLAAEGKAMLRYGK
jgi:DNA polymerase